MPQRELSIAMHGPADLLSIYRFHRAQFIALDLRWKMENAIVNFQPRNLTYHLTAIGNFSKVVD